MATSYTGRCGVAECRWQFSARSPALITELYSNHFNKTHTGRATLAIEPGGLAVAWPPEGDALLRLNLAESPSQSRARATRQLRLASASSSGAAAFMFLVAVFLLINPAWTPASRVALGAPIFWVGIFVPLLLFSIGGTLSSIRVTGSRTSEGFRPTVLGLLVAAVVSDILLAIVLTAGLITVADMSLNGDLPNAFSNLYVLDLFLSWFCLFPLVGSVMLFRRASKTGPGSGSGT